jgi:hypothetical protein
MLDILPIWIIFLFMAVFSGYYVYMAWYKPEEFRRSARGWARGNPLLPDSWGESKIYVTLTQITMVLTFVVGSMMFLVLSLAILKRLF